MAVSALVCLVLVGALALIDRAAGHKPVNAVPAPSSSASASATATPKASSSPSPTPTASVSTSDGSEGETADAAGMKHTGLTGKGTWKGTTLTIAPARKEPVVHRVTVRAEDGTSVTADDAARQVMSVLNDPRGWLGHKGQSFELVANPAQAEFTISLASPGTAQKMCPLDVKMTWSCRAGKNVILNTDRWLYMTPTFNDLTAYRAYMVNHEVGHYIGFGHLGCAAKGQPAPVMMQQSKALDGCTANPWPTASEKK